MDHMYYEMIKGHLYASIFSINYFIAEGKKVNGWLGIMGWGSSIAASSRPFVRGFLAILHALVKVHYQRVIMSFVTSK